MTGPGYRRVPGTTIAAYVCDADVGCFLLYLGFRTLRT
jgi:hypothetical protein